METASSEINIWTVAKVMGMFNCLQDCSPFVPGACMLTSGHLMDEAVFHGLVNMKCRPECSKQPESCSGKVDGADAGVTAIEAGSGPDSGGADGQAIAALITSVVLLIAAAALLVWLLFHR